MRRRKKSGAYIRQAGRKYLSRTKREGEKREKGKGSIMKNNQNESEESPIIAKKKSVKKS